MKKIIILLVSICTITAAYGQGTIKIDTKKSVINWRGYNLFKFNEHYGTVKFLKGEVLWIGGSVMGGNFEVDMNTILNTDGKYNEMLVSHLKNKDFFDVEKYPEAKLSINQAKYIDGKHMDIDALLTIKGITKPVKFKMTIEQQGKVYELKSKFVIDRTRWGISYESQGLVGSLKEDIISDAIEFEVIIVFQLLC
ncbi:YceI family protein [Flagellimonas sp.]|uniref:YceI family protein n=1 Tax=Flagellimonas sp. TaxID=2058762 RepID=UPI003B5B5F80